MRRYSHKTFDRHETFKIEGLTPIKENVPNLFFVGGYVAGTYVMNDMDDTFWIANGCSILDLEKVNVFIVLWDSRSYKEITNDFLASPGIMKAVNYFFDKHSFKKAFKNAETTGVLLAKSLIKFRETHSGPIYLFGHSLGGKISLECTDYMYAFNQHIIDKLILLGTAEYTGERVYNAIEVVGSITNCYNPNDGVLFYGLGIMSKILGIRRFNNPMNVIGIRSIEGFNNIDCSELIKTDNYKMYGHNYSSAIVSIIQSIGI